MAEKMKEDYIPVQVGAYKVLVKASQVTRLYENIAIVKEQLVKELPKPSEDPVFLDLEEEAVMIPEVVRKKQQPLTAESEQQESTNVSEDVPPPIPSEDSDDDNPKQRFSWRSDVTKQLLSAIREKKVKSENFSYKKSVWASVAKEISSHAGFQVNGDQCRERFYTLKRRYKKYLDECNKTGNKTPRPFLFEDQMHSILKGDPAFRPLVCKSSLGAVEVNETPESDEEASTEIRQGTSKSESSSGSGKRKRKSSNEDLKEFLRERDEKFFSMFKEMQETQNSLLEKLIDKL